MIDSPDAFCDECRELSKQHKFKTFQRFDRMRSFLRHDQDDLLSTTYYVCAICTQLWQEDDCDYHLHAGYFWHVISWQEFLRIEGERLPPTVERTVSGCQRWIAHKAVTGRGKP